MPKNIDNLPSGSGASVSNTDDVPEGALNLYFTNDRVVDALVADTSYKNAEALYGVPIDGASNDGGQVLVSNGAEWQTTKHLMLNNSNLVVSAGAYATPNAYYGRRGPVSFIKAIGNQKTMTIITPNTSSGFIELFISAREPTAGTKYHTSQSFFYENVAGVVTITTLAGFHSPEFTLIPLANTIEVRLNTPLDSTRTTSTVQYQTITGADLTLTIP